MESLPISPAIRPENINNPSPKPSKNKLSIFVIAGFFTILTITVTLQIFYNKEVKNLPNQPKTTPQAFSDIGNHKSIIAESTGDIREMTLSDSPFNNNSLKIDTLKINFNDSTGKQTSLNIAVQIIPEKSGSNIIPWFLEGAYKDKLGKTLTKQTLSLSDLRNLFNEGSTWLFVPLLNTNLSEGPQTKDAYLNYLYGYYNEDEWNNLAVAYQNDFENFNFTKPVLISKLFYYKE